MKEQFFIDGQVRMQSLPLLAVAGDSGEPDLKLLDLPQGRLAQFCPPDLAVRYMAWVELREGAVRGNHYHDRKIEWIYLIEGELELTVEDRASKAREVVPLAAGDLAVIEAGVAHALLPLVAGQCIEFSPVPFDPSDSERYPLI